MTQFDCHVTFAQEVTISHKLCKNIVFNTLKKHIIMYSVQQQIHFNGNVFGNKHCRYNEDSLYINIYKLKMDKINN